MLMGESKLGRNMPEIAFPCLRFPYLINVNIILYIYICICLHLLVSISTSILFRSLLSLLAMPHFAAGQPSPHDRRKSTKGCHCNVEVSCVCVCVCACVCKWCLEALTLRLHCSHKWCHAFLLSSPYYEIGFWSLHYISRCIRKPWGKDTKKALSSPSIAYRREGRFIPP